MQAKHTCKVIVDSRKRIFHLHLSPHFASLSINPLVYWSPSPRPAADRRNETMAEYVNLTQEDRGTKRQNSKDFNQMFIVFCRKKISMMILPYFLLFFVLCSGKVFPYFVWEPCYLLVYVSNRAHNNFCWTHNSPAAAEIAPPPPPVYGAEKAEQSREDSLHITLVACLAACLIMF